jgi:hypothetical protein
MRNADRIHPEWQERVIGETVFLHWAHGLQVTRFEPNRVIALEGWGTFVVEPAAEGRTRLFARGRMKRGPMVWLYTTLLEIPHFLMERRMLLAIKERAEGRRPQRGSGRSMQIGAGTKASPTEARRPHP